jgi:hypothetical protein
MVGWARVVMELPTAEKSQTMNDVQHVHWWLSEDLVDGTREPDLSVNTCSQDIVKGYDSFDPKVMKLVMVVMHTTPSCVHIRLRNASSQYAILVLY